MTERYMTGRRFFALGSLAGGQLERFFRPSSLGTELQTDPGIEKGLYSLTFRYLV